ncbi:choice-of-anchor I family protein [Oceanospirillum sediminis]|uniref:Choice-of-anchor I family protein n=1 Tax=Oceanospirillum sediminis TaxID=2760088 RepID=A0A839IMZ0_9GAMM|nr:choice-of-anchor I family protein [Oceanospirillum sediminis]MBB1486064.1 choice-of-anchor I family protein [Oceanospirillum sediminis]
MKKLALTALAGAVSSVLLTGCQTTQTAQTVVNPDIGGGQVLLYSADGQFIDAANVGHLPDMVRFVSASKLVVANEGEPSDDYRLDPEGSVSFITLSDDKKVAQVSTQGFANVPVSGRVRIKPGSTLKEDLEPEYIAVNKDGSRAWVSLQENNAIGLIDLNAEKITEVKGLGEVRWRGQAVDLSDDGKAQPVQSNPENIYALYQPDTIASYRVNGKDYLVTANEGDDREYDGWEDYIKAKKLKNSQGGSALSAELQQQLSAQKSESLRVFRDMGQDNDGVYRQLYMAGTRSFSIRDMNGELIFDSGSEFEQTLASILPQQFNSRVDGDEEGFFFEGIDARSLKKGAEPEALALAEIGTRHFAYIGLEKQGGIFVYDITNPYQPRQVEYFNDINYEQKPENAGDLEPEGMVTFEQNGVPYLAVANEMSATVSLYQLGADGRLNKLSSVSLGNFDEGAAEIIDYNPENQMLYVTNGELKRVDMVSTSDPEAISISGFIDFSEHADDLQSVSVKDGVVAIAVSRRD